MSFLLDIHEPGQTPDPHANEAGIAVGIDLGTTHSVVAIATESGVEMLSDPHGNRLIPSVVEYGGDAPVVGLQAKEAWAAGVHSAVASVKRQMHVAGVKLPIGKTPVEVSVDILKHLKQMAEVALGQEVTQAVITVPAYFDDTARAATKDAARLAGLEVLRLVAEPTAAALAYGLDSGAQGIYVVYDLGGGTFDVSVLKLDSGVFQVLATGGDTALGGDDFDRLLAEAHFGNTQAGSLAQARVMKESFSLLPSRLREGQGEGKSNGNGVLPPPVSPSQPPPQAGEGLFAFEALITPLVDRTIAITENVLADAGVTPQQVQGVVMAGGSTRIPLVRRKVEALFGKPALADINPDEVVAVGAALQARNLTVSQSALLLDVIPLSLGLETIGGLVEKLLHRNAPIPTSITQEFTTWQDGQTGMQIHVLQGEREMVEQNRSLAKFELLGIPSLPAGIARIAVTFAVDADGLLTVSAREKTTGVAQAVEVRPSYGLPPEEIERMLLESMQHARADITARLLAEAKMEAERSVIELESAMHSSTHLLSDQEKRLLEIQIGYVREAIAEGDRDRIDMELAELGRAGQAFAERRMNDAIAKALGGKGVEEVVKAVNGGW